MMDARINRPSKIGALRDRLFDLLQEHKHDDALPTSARFLFYELVQRGQLSKTATGKRRPDQDLHDALIDLRERGIDPWSWIEDETRFLNDYSGDPTVLQGVLARLPYINLDPWDGAAPMILTESRAVGGVLRNTASDYRCRIAATNGHVGGFLRTEVAPALRANDLVLYFGDWDHVGNQIEANTRKVLEDLVGELRWERVALTDAQAMTLPRIIKYDRRYKDGRPHEAVETEALRQTVLVDLLRETLDGLLPEPLTRVQERERRQRLRIERMLRRAAP